MKLEFPYSFKNCVGETIIFHELVEEAGGDRLVGLCYRIKKQLVKTIFWLFFV
jgi:hypothetical protein